MMSAILTKEMPSEANKDDELFCWNQKGKDQRPTGQLSAIYGPGNRMEFLTFVTSV